jgi:hypothetical protein
MVEDSSVRGNLASITEPVGSLKGYLGDSRRRVVLIPGGLEIRRERGRS